MKIMVATALALITSGVLAQDNNSYEMRVNVKGLKVDEPIENGGEDNVSEVPEPPQTETYSCTVTNMSRYTEYPGTCTDGSFSARIGRDTVSGTCDGYSYTYILAGRPQSGTCLEGYPSSYSCTVSIRTTPVGSENPVYEIVTGLCENGAFSAEMDGQQLSGGCIGSVYEVTYGDYANRGQC